jgi:hypothetical protein
MSRSTRHFVTEWEGFDVGLLDADPTGGAHRWVATYTGTGPKVAMQELAAVGDAGDIVELRFHLRPVDIGGKGTTSESDIMQATLLELLATATGARVFPSTDPGQDQSTCLMSSCPAASPTCAARGSAKVSAARS